MKTALASSFRRKSEGGFTFEVQQLSEKGLSRRRAVQMRLQSCFIRECIEDTERGLSDAKGKPCRRSCFFHNQWLRGFQELFDFTFFTRSCFQYG